MSFIFHVGDNRIILISGHNEAFKNSKYKFEARISMECEKHVYFSEKKSRADKNKSPECAKL